MKNLLPPVDRLGFIRFLHLHCFIHMYRTFFSSNASDNFSQARFNLFRQVKQLYKKKQTSNILLKNILYTYHNQIIIGSVITLIFASCNLLVPQLIKSFLHFIQQIDIKKSQIVTAQSFIQKFFVIQILRIMFGQHAKRLFYQLAIQIESNLSKKLIEKALSFEKQCRDRIPKSEILQLENVDLKLIFNMFKNIYLLVQAPFTIIVAIFMLFKQSNTYGFIGIYWFLVVFLVQRQLDGRMMHCNATKLKLIDQRSKINYELFGKMKQAKLIHYEDILIEKNNNLFIEQNHDHHLFYFYSTLYDISLLILPIVVVVTISLFDMNNNDHITVEQVYAILQLITICNNPMKSFRTITINLHDGLHSLNRLQKFFNLPDSTDSTLINENIEAGQILIKKDTICVYPQGNNNFQLHITQHIQLKKGDRLFILGKKGHGKSSFLRMLLGMMKNVQGVVFISGTKASAFDTDFFTKSTILENILFSQEQKMTQAYKQKAKLAEALFKELSSVDTGVSLKDGIHANLDKRVLTKQQLKKISLIRTLVCNPDIYFIQNAYSTLDMKSSQIIQRHLRQKQKQRKTIIISQANLEYVEQNDYILILENGISKEFDTFKNLLHNPISDVSKYFKTKSDQQPLKQPDSGRKILSKFKNRLTTAISFQPQFLDPSTVEQDYLLRLTNKKKQLISLPNSPYLKRQISLAKGLKIKKKEKKQIQFSKFWQYFTYYLRSVSLFQLVYVRTFLLILVIIIAVAQFLHIFIHFFIGHLDQEQHDNPYTQFRDVLIIQFILTMALAVIIYFEGQVSSLISIIQGNSLYSQSLKMVIKKPISWFNLQFSIKLADKFNHDYQQIFIACHFLLNIYKNIVILLITIYIISVDKSTLFITMSCVASLYIGIGIFLRKVEHKVVHHYYDYKYQFVKIFQQCIEGGLVIQVYGKKQYFLAKAEKAYKHIAAYKLAESYTSYGEEILCDLTSLIILVFAFQYGLQMKAKGNNISIALVGTIIHLLLNVSEVLKNIVKLTINFQTFFNINIAPFLELILEDQQFQKENSSDGSKQSITLNSFQQSLTQNRRKYTEFIYDIELKNVDLHNKQQSCQQNGQLLNLKIPQQSNVLIYEANEHCRAKILHYLTKNIKLLQNQNRKGLLQTQNKGLLQASKKGLLQSSKKKAQLTIGNHNINEISSQLMPQYIGVISKKNFFFAGTLRENITFRKSKITIEDQKFIMKMARFIQLDLDLKDFDELGLDSKIQYLEGLINSQFSKKIALLRIFVRKPKIIIIENTSSFIGQSQIVNLIRRQYFCTIIKLTNNIQQAHDSARIIYMQNLRVLEDGKTRRFESNPSSKIGQLLKQANVDAYIYQNQAVSPRKIGIKSPYLRSSQNSTITLRSDQ